MRRGRKTNTTGAIIGFTSLLLIMATLCLAMFVAFAVSSASADMYLTDRTSATVSDYYTASNNLQRFLYDLDDQQAPDKKSPAAILATYDGAALTEEADVLVVDFPAGERLYLRAWIEQPSGGSRYELLAAVVVTADEDLDNSLGGVWEG